MVADIVQQNIRIPVIHIAEVTATEIKRKGIQKIGMLGTKATMEKEFFRNKLAQQKIEMLIPDSAEREFIHASIFGELTKGIFAAATKAKYLGAINRLISAGAEGIIFGCTEIPLLIKQQDCPVPVFDTTLIHANAAADFALG
jgi:aspartate racemase